MITRFIIIAGLVVMAACQSAPNDPAAVEQVILDYQIALSDNNQKAAEEVCTTDYVLIDEGLYLNNDSLFALVSPMFEQGATASYHFDEFRTFIDGRVAWAYYNNYGEINMAGDITHYKWAVSAVFKHEAGKWKLALMHLTEIKQKPSASE